MKKIVAFLLSASMCLSLLTVLTPAFGFEQNGRVAVMSFGDPDDKDEKEHIGPQGDNN